jgi:hypothetical protein
MSELVALEAEQDKIIIFIFRFYMIIPFMYHIVSLVNP